MKTRIVRCPWAANDEVLFDYHDQEWGVPNYDSRAMFEMLCLELMQAGLSWRTILLKRDSMRAAFSQFQPEKIARFNKAKVEKLLQDPGIIRNRLKVQAIINNARHYLALEKQGCAFSDFIWQRVAHQPIIIPRKYHEDLPNRTALSDEMSKHLQAHGFRFVGSTICYAFMQAIGMVNDHLESCDFYRG